MLQCRNYADPNPKLKNSIQFYLANQIRKNEIFALVFLEKFEINDFSKPIILEKGFSYVEFFSKTILMCNHPMMFGFEAEKTKYLNN